MTEAVVRLAQASNWLAVHFLPGIMPNGDWRTPFIGDSGFPDVIAVRGGRLLVVENKHGRNKVEDHQRKWLVALEEAGAEMKVWRAEDMAEIRETLK